MDWTLLVEDSRRLQSFHMSCQRQILGARWNDQVRNSDVAVQTGLPNITTEYQTGAGWKKAQDHSRNGVDATDLSCLCVMMRMMTQI